MTTIKTISAERGKFEYKNKRVFVSGLHITFLRDEHKDTWGMKCPLCGKMFAVGDDCRVIYTNHVPFENTMVHTECINPCGGLKDVCEEIERLFSEWKKLSGIWNPEV